MPKEKVFKEKENRFQKKNLGKKIREGSIKESKEGSRRKNNPKIGTPGGRTSIRLDSLSPKFATDQGFERGIWRFN